jgi:hypothetical protein
MPYGRYKDRPVIALPDAYLVWLTSRGIPPELRTAIEQEILCRIRAAPPSDGRARTPPPDVAEAVVTAGLRSLAKQNHPDVGGTHEDMLQVTAAADWLRDLLRQHRTAA